MKHELKIVLASNNQHKLHEISQMLSGKNIQLISQSEFAVPEAEENAPTFIENALIKARNASKKTGLPALADDSGLEIDALNGEPGIHSARFSGEHGNHQKNIAKVLELLHDVPQEKRTARFQCLMVFLRHALDPTPIICQGTWEGEILTTPRGNNGFGYDPIFWIPELQLSAAELNATNKNNISHRGLALQKMAAEIL